MRSPTAGATDRVGARGPKPTVVHPERLARLRAKLRGRKAWLAAALIGGAGVGVAVGYHTTQPWYRATAEAIVKPITFEGPAASPDAPAADAAADQTPAWRLRVIEDGVTQQLALLHSAKLRRSAWQAEADTPDQATPEHTPAPRNAAARALPDSLGRIEITCLDTDPSRAAQSLTRLLVAYTRSELYQAQQVAAEQALRQWAAREVALDKLEGVTAQIDRVRGAQNINQLIADRGQTDARLNAIDLRVAAIDVGLALLAQTNDKAPAWAQMPAEERQAMARQRADLVEEIAELEHSGGNWFQLSLKSFQQILLDGRAWLAWKAEPRAAVRGIDGDASPAEPLTRDQLVARKNELSRLAAPLREERAALDQTITKLRGLHAQADTLRRQAAHHQLVLTRLSAEPPHVVATVGTAVRPPAEAYRDDRALHAQIGAAVGGGGAFCLALILVLLDDRMRRPDERVLRAAQAPALGALPMLPHDATTQANAELAALSMHQLRARLESLAERQGRHSFAVLSADPGAGKTSVAVGLAASLATAGHRALLIDCDLTGKDKPASARTPSPGGLQQVLQAMGHLAEHNAELMVADHHRLGLLGALRGRPIKHCVVETHLPGLDALPAIGATPAHAALLSGKAIRRLVALACEDYDYVLLDAGNVPGSVEALLAAANVDGVVMVVTPRQRQRAFDRALGQLRMVGASVVGTVFNRAANRDARADLGPRHAGSRAGRSKHQPWQPVAFASGSGIFAAAVESQAHNLPALAPPRKRVESRPPESVGVADEEERGLPPLPEGEAPAPPPKRPKRIPPPNRTSTPPPAQASGPPTPQAQLQPQPRPADEPHPTPPPPPAAPAPISEPDVSAHRMLANTVDEMIRSTIDLATRQNQPRARDAAQTSPPPPEVSPEFLEESPESGEESATPPPQPAASSPDDGANQLDQTIDQLIESMHHKDR